MKGGSGIRRKEVMGMDALIVAYIKELKLASGLNRQRIFAAWDTASGAARYTLNRYFDKGTLVVTLSSAMVRNHTYMQKDSILKSINEILANDELFVRKENEKTFVKALILK